MAVLKCVRQLMLSGLFLCFGLAAAQQGRFIAYYGPAANEAHEGYRVDLGEIEYLENLLLPFSNTFELPRDLQVSLRECHENESGAFYAPWLSEITICYSFIDLLLDLMAEVSENSGATVIDALTFVLYHEMGHALIDIYELPSTGREEDAVDQFSTLLLVWQGQSHSALAGARTFDLFNQVFQQTPAWGEHALNDQRFYNIICLVYGSDPVKHAWVIEYERPDFFEGPESGGFLPVDRAYRCEDEYEKGARAWEHLMAIIPEPASPPAVVVENAPGPAPSASPTPVQSSVPSGATEVIEGNISGADDSLDDGRYVDSYIYTLAAGDGLELDLSSLAFDAMLMVLTPEGNAYLRDDRAENDSNPRLTVPALVAGDYTVVITPYQTDSVGDYTLSVTPLHDSFTEFSTADLSVTDSTFDDGAYYDTYDYELTAGTIFRASMVSPDFDGFIAVLTPSDDFIYGENYTASGAASLTLDITETGTYTLVMSSREPAVLGSYQLAVGQNSGADTSMQASTAPSVPTTPAPPAPATPAPPAPEASAQALPEAKPSNLGNLAAGDLMLEDGTYMDMYTVMLVAGQSLSVRLMSSDFDPYLALLTPGEDFIDGDNSDTTRSLLTFVAEQAGVYTIGVSSSSPTSGNYLLSVQTDR